MQPVHGEILIMRPLGCKTIPGNVPSKQNVSVWQIAAGLSPPLPPEFVDSGSGESGSYCKGLSTKARCG